MAEETPPENGSPFRNGFSRKDYMWVLASMWVCSIAMRAVMMWSLLHSNPPDKSWDLIQNAQNHLTSMDLLLAGGILGLAKK